MAEISISIEINYFGSNCNIVFTISSHALMHIFPKKQSFCLRLFAEMLQQQFKFKIIEIHKKKLMTAAYYLSFLNF